MNSFPEWFKDLCSDVRWYENAVMSCRGKNFKGAAEFVYAQLLADPALQLRSMVENRKHVYNRLTKMDFERVFPQLQQPKEEEKEATQILTYTKEHADKCAAEALEIIRNSKTLNAVPRIPYKQQVEEGGWIPKKEAPYPVTSVEEAYIKDRHLAYITYAYEPRTAVKMPGVMDEEQFNLEYDEMMLKKLGK